MTSWDWNADPGEKTSVTDALPLNFPSLLPLFNPVNPDPSGGKGSNTNPAYEAGAKHPQTSYANANPDPATGSNLYVNVVKFVGVMITYVNGKLVYAEPSPVIPPGGMFGSITPADSTSSNFYTTFSMPRLTKPGG